MTAASPRREHAPNHPAAVPRARGVCRPTQGHLAMGTCESKVRVAVRPWGERAPLSFALFTLLFGTGACSLDPMTRVVATRPAEPATGPGVQFLRSCAFVCVDIQPGIRRHIEEEQVPVPWKKSGFTAADVNAATNYAFDVAFPNARIIAEACRDLRLPMIFVHS